MVIASFLCKQRALYSLVFSLFLFKSYVWSLIFVSEVENVIATPLHIQNENRFLKYNLFYFREYFLHLRKRDKKQTYIKDTALYDKVVI